MTFAVQRLFPSAPPLCGGNSAAAPSLATVSRCNYTTEESAEPCWHRLDPERWLSGRKRRFAKPVRGVNLLHGFESRPLRSAFI
jgi:hypothetical protein